MKTTTNTIYLILTILLSLSIQYQVKAQSPEKMSYQAVIRDSNNNLVISEQVGVKISIIKGSVNGTADYVESHLVSTNENGLVSLEIGEGTLVNGDFSSIDWSNGNYFIRTETDLNGGSNYTITGTSKLLSVPYSLHSKESVYAKYILDEYVNIWNDNTTVNLEANKKYFIRADNTTLVFPDNPVNFQKDNIEVYVMQHQDNPRNITLQTNGFPIGVSETDNTFWNWTQGSITGFFNSGYNKIINIGDYWMCGSFTPFKRQ